MANDYFVYTTGRLTDGSTAYAADVNTIFDLVEDGFDLVPDTDTFQAIADAAEASATAAAASAAEAVAAAASTVESATYAQLAEDYANEAEDVEVEPGKYSAYHWSKKAEALTQDVTHVQLKKYGVI